MIERKLSKLSENEKGLLLATSVLGRDFDFRLVQEMMGVDEEILVDALDSLLDSELLIEIEGEGERYRFRRQITQDIVYGGLSRARRSLLHKKAGFAM